MDQTAGNGWMVEMRAGDDDEGDGGTLLVMW